MLLLLMLTALGHADHAGALTAGPTDSLQLIIRQADGAGWWFALPRPLGGLEAIRLGRCYRWRNQVLLFGSAGESDRHANFVKFAPGPAERPGATWTRSIGVQLFDGACSDGPMTGPTFTVDLMQPDETVPGANNIGVVDSAQTAQLHRLDGLTTSLASSADSSWRKGPFGVVDWCGGEAGTVRRLYTSLDGQEPRAHATAAGNQCPAEAVPSSKACPNTLAADCQLLTLLPADAAAQSGCRGQLTVGVTRPGSALPAWASPLEQLLPALPRARCATDGPLVASRGAVVSLAGVASSALPSRIHPSRLGVLSNLSTRAPYVLPLEAPPVHDVSVVSDYNSGSSNDDGDYPQTSSSSSSSSSGDEGFFTNALISTVTAVLSLPAIGYYMCCMARDYCCIIPMRDCPSSRIVEEDMVHSTLRETTVEYSESTRSWSSRTVTTYTLKGEHNSWTWCSPVFVDNRVLYTACGSLPMDGVHTPYRGSQRKGCYPRICGIIAVGVIGSMMASASEFAMGCFVVIIVLLLPPWLLICTALCRAQMSCSAARAERKVRDAQLAAERDAAEREAAAGGALKTDGDEDRTPTSIVSPASTEAGGTPAASVTTPGAASPASMVRGSSALNATRVLVSPSHSATSGTRSPPVDASAKVPSLGETNSENN